MNDRRFEMQINTADSQMKTQGLLMTEDEFYGYRNQNQKVKTGFNEAQNRFMSTWIIATALLILCGAFFSEHLNWLMYPIVFMVGGGVFAQLLNKLGE